MAEVKWIKLASDLFDNRKIKQIRNMPDGDAIIVIWLQILCLAGNTNNNGLVFFSKDIPYTDEMFATEFDRPLSTIRMSLNIFVKFGMIEIINDVILVSNWEKYQNTDSLEKIREQTRKRVARHREKILLEDKSNVTETLQVTLGNATDIDKEVDIEVDKEKKRNIGIFESYANNNKQLLEALKNFEKMRKQMKKPLTDRAKELLIEGLVELEESGENIIDCLNQSILNSWLGVFPVKRGDSSGVNKKSDGKNESKSGWPIETTRL